MLYTHTSSNFGKRQLGIRQTIWHGVKNRNYYSGEVVGKRLSGEKFSMFISVATMRDEEGKVLGAMGVGRDITDLKIAEQELKASEEGTETF